MLVPGTLSCGLSGGAHGRDDASGAKTVNAGGWGDAALHGAKPLAGKRMTQQRTKTD